MSVLINGHAYCRRSYRWKFCSNLFRSSGFGGNNVPSLLPRLNNSGLSSDSNLRGPLVSIWTKIGPVITLCFMVFLARNIWSLTTSYNVWFALCFISEAIWNSALPSWKWVMCACAIARTLQKITLSRIMKKPISTMGVLHVFTFECGIFKQHISLWCGPCASRLPFNVVLQTTFCAASVAWWYLYQFLDFSAPADHIFDPTKEMASSNKRHDAHGRFG